jgi:hypothetical protein
LLPSAARYSGPYPGAPARAAAPPPSIDDWLRTHSNITKAVVWDFGKGWQRLDARLAELGGPQKVRELQAESARNYDQASIATTVR